MVYVKVRETYDLHTLRDKISVIGIHTPQSGIIKKNYPGLLMQCKGYRPVSCDVRMACASMLPLDPLGVGTGEGDVAPEDVFNPILYKAVSNWSMSQIETLLHAPGLDEAGDTLDYINNGITNDDFAIYYGLLSQTNEWKHANPQSGLSMSNLIPLVYETYQNIGQNGTDGASNPMYGNGKDDTVTNMPVQTFRGRSHPLPMLNCTTPAKASANTSIATASAGFPAQIVNGQVDVPAPKVMCGIIIVPPSRQHQLFYRLVCEWTLEFSQIRSLADIMTFNGLASLGNATHFMSYSFDSKILTEETAMIDTSEGSEIHKVM